MKTSTILLAFTMISSLFVTAQDRTIVTSTSADISNHLDLKAVASIFGDSENLEDFERRLNDPNLQISNLDLNNDRQVDYLRVIESVEGITHLIVLQSVLERDVFQDVATIEVERQQNNQVQIQVVGDVFMYGHNYIYEPIYVTRPMIYNTFCASNYQPYYSGWSWNFYPTYYYAWTPFPIYRYRNHIHQHINIYHSYNYVNVRRSDRAAALYASRRANGYERIYPTRSFEMRNANVSNSYELNNRTTRNTLVRSQSSDPRHTTAANARQSNFRQLNQEVRPQMSTPKTNIMQNGAVAYNSNARPNVSSGTYSTNTSRTQSNDNARMRPLNANSGSVQNTQRNSANSIRPPRTSAAQINKTALRSKQQSNISATTNARVQNNSARGGAVRFPSRT